ncbi:ABC transporter substrate-binding protein [Methylopila sp. M107]|uniref:ABC transporter substrate-binding protein n=1 Tax=Methylopila sp. M107 TaxID=1101190 RepID=UPI000375427A|nr:ABC transporter substrate-binding protein [Methylopila sp. M107]
MLNARTTTTAILIAFGAAIAAVMPAGAQSSEELLTYARPAEPPPGYPAAYVNTVRAAENEGRLVIYSNTDAKLAQPLVDDFRSMYPRIDVSYEDINSTELYHRFVAETQLRSGTADVLWSSAMDQQAALVSDGYAMAYDSPEDDKLPSWSNWKHQAFGTTYEPVVFAYNKDLLPKDKVPKTRADLVRLLSEEPERFKGKVSSYNIEKSGLGFFLAAQDAAISPDFWNLAKALGRTETQLELTTGAMARDLVGGRTIIGYNVLGAYVAKLARENPSIGYVYPSDYTIVLSRILIANKNAAHPNAAKLWIDYILSKRGQTIIANKVNLFSIREDVEGEATAAHLKQTLGASERPVSIGPALIGYLNNQNYRDFILQWQKALAGKP